MEELLQKKDICLTGQCTCSATLKHELFESYFEARKKKRNKQSQLAFELNYEAQLFSLHQQIVASNYTVLPERAFLVHQPVLREIFAADFRDRVIHHLLFRFLNPFVDSVLIADCYSCRSGKGTSYGIARVQKFIRASSANYQHESFILKLDIQSYFMSINKQILWVRLLELLNKKAIAKELNLSTCMTRWYFELLHQVVFHDSKVKCIITGNKQGWNLLPKSKSLFYAQTGCGLPIGNLTSQLFGNLYLANFDSFVKKKLKVSHYVRYVDDMIFIGSNKFDLLNVKNEVENYLQRHLGLKLHPNKIHLQSYKKGVVFLGVKIFPYHLLPSVRVRKNYSKLVLESKNNLNFTNRYPNKRNAEFKLLQARHNAFLGFFSHTKSYHFRKRKLDNLFSCSPQIMAVFYLDKSLSKLVFKKMGRNKNFYV